MNGHQILVVLRTPIPAKVVFSMTLTIGIAALAFMTAISISDPWIGVATVAAVLLGAFWPGGQKRQRPGPPRPPAGKPVPPPKTPPAVSGALKEPLPEPEEERIAARIA